MGTTAAPVIQELPTADERFVRVIFQPKDEVNEKGEKVTPEVVIYSSEDDANEAVKAGKGVIMFAQTFSYARANTDDGVKEVCPVEKERVKMFNNGVSVKAQNRARSLLLAQDENGNYEFQPTEVYDLRELVAKESAERGKTAYNKAVDLITGGKLTPDQIEALKALLAQPGA